MEQKEDIQNRVDRTKHFLQHKLMESSYYKDHPSEREYRFEHSIRVAHIGKVIAEGEGLNIENMILGCLLHDVAYCMSFDEMGDWNNHGRISAQIARPFLLDLGLSMEDVEEICYGIAIHVDDQADFDGIRTKLALSIGEADNIDRFDAYRIFEGLKYNEYDIKSLEEKRIFVKQYLHRLEVDFRNVSFSTNTGKQMWIEKIDFQTEFYKKLLKQIENSTI